MSGEAEWQTRKKRIDTRLKQKGWKLLPFSPGLNLTNLDRCAIARDDCRRTEEFLQANGLSRSSELRQLNLPFAVSTNESPGFARRA